MKLVNVFSLGGKMVENAAAVVGYSSGLNKNNQKKNQNEFKVIC